MRSTTVFIDPKFARASYIPLANNTYDLGSAALNFRNLFLSSNITLSATAALIRTNTSDGADNKSISITSADAVGANRGGYLTLNGNEQAGSPGNTILSSGNITNAGLYLDAIASNGVIYFRTGANLIRWQINSNGQLVQDGTNGGNIIFSRDDNGFNANTSNRQLAFCGGTNASTATGAVIYIQGIDYSGTNNGGNLILNGGFGTNGGRIELTTRDVSAARRRWYLQYNSGNLIQDPTYGQDIVMTRANTNLALPTSTGLTAAGTTISDALQLDKAVNNVTTAASGTGVKLYIPNTVGSSIVVKNRGANTINVFPPNGSGVIDGLSAGAAFTLSSGSSAIFFYLATNTWITV